VGRTKVVLSQMPPLLRECGANNTRSAMSKPH
jgi:hypothetical protein